MIRKRRARQHLGRSVCLFNRLIWYLIGWRRLCRLDSLAARCLVLWLGFAAVDSNEAV